MARGIVRLSLDSSGPGAHLATAKRQLTPTFHAVARTGTMEGYGSANDLLDALSDLITHLRDDLPTGVSLDHLWIYVDKARPTT